METYKEIKGDLIVLAKQGKFDVISHGTNCFCIQGAGIAPQMAKSFGTDLFDMENESYSGDINKLGTIDYEYRESPLWFTRKIPFNNKGKGLFIVNSYTQYNLGPNHKEGISIPLDYNALRLCMKKINHIFAGKHIGLPQIGAGLAGGDWKLIKQIIQEELKDMQVTVVIYDKPKENFKLKTRNKMCLSNIKGPFVARKDIVCYKRFKINDDGILYSPFQNARWPKEGMEGPIIAQQSCFSDKLIVEVGLHAYIELKDALDSIQNNYQTYRKMIIPKGSIYYRGQFDGPTKSIAASKMVFSRYHKTKKK